MARRLLFLWALLLAPLGAACADIRFSYTVTGAPQCLQDGTNSTCLTPAASGQDVTIPPTGADIVVATYPYMTNFTMTDGRQGPWSGTLTITDAASGETKAVTIGGMYYWNMMYSWADVSPKTVDVGKTRYILTNGPAADAVVDTPLYAHVMAQPLDQPHPVFTTQPGGARAKDPLRPQPVVTVLNPDGSVAAGYNGAVTLSVRPGTGNPDGYTLLGTKTINAVNGVAAFTSIALSAEGRYILTAVAENLTSVDSEPVTVLLPLGPDPPVRYQTSGTETFSRPTSLGGELRLTVTAESSGTVAVKQTGTSISLARFDYSGSGAARDGLGGAWSAGLELTDEASGETVRTTLGGAFTLEACCTYPMSPLTTSVFPRTVVAGGRRYTITSGSNGSAPWETDSRQYLSGIITYHPPEQPGLAFRTQPGGRAGSLILDPQPVVVMRKADGSVDTYFNGPVTLMVSPGTPTDGMLAGDVYGQVTRNAVSGVASFENLVLVQDAENVTLTAFSGTSAGADSLPFSVGKAALFAEAISALKIAGGLQPQASPVPVTLQTALSLARRAAGL